MGVHTYKKVHKYTFYKKNRHLRSKAFFRFFEAVNKKRKRVLFKKNVITMYVNYVISAICPEGHKR